MTHERCRIYLRPAATNTCAHFWQPDYPICSLCLDVRLLSSPPCRAQSPMPAVSTLMTAAAEQSSVPSERAEAFSQHLGQCFFAPKPRPTSPCSLLPASCFHEPSSCFVTAKKLPNVMVLGSYQLPAEPAILHEVAAREILTRLQPLLKEAA